MTLNVTCPSWRNFTEGNSLLVLYHLEGNTKTSISFYQSFAAQWNSYKSFTIEIKHTRKLKKSKKSYFYLAGLIKLIEPNSNHKYYIAVLIYLLTMVVCLGLAYQGKDIVFIFIIEYSSLRDFGLSNRFIFVCRFLKDDILALCWNLRLVIEL
jgi:hypothetical protein